MDVLRRNTDYALRAMVNLARCFGKEAAPTRRIAEKEQIPYQLACKLMQKLHRTGLVESIMGPDGGFKLRRAPGKITLLQIINAVQGPVVLNRCLLASGACPQKKGCVVSRKLAGLQKHVEHYMSALTLRDLV